MPRVRNAKPVAAKRATVKRATAKRATTKKATAKAPPKKVAKKRTPVVRNKKKMTMIQRLRLAERITVARAKDPPVEWAEIARSEKIPERTCYHVYASYRDEQVKLGDGSGVSILNETLMLYTYSIEKLAYEAEHGENSASRVGAIRTLLDANKGRIEILSVMGRMPRSFRAMDELAALTKLVRQIAEVVERHELPAAVVEEFIGLAEGVQPIIDGTAEQAALPPAA